MTPERANSLAHRIAEAEGWPWGQPVEVTSHRRWLVGARYWVVRTGAGTCGSNVRVEIDDETERILLKGFMPR
jgi:hypothetical protein